MLMKGEKKFPLTEVIFFFLTPSWILLLLQLPPAFPFFFLFEPRAPPVTSVFLLENKLHPFPTAVSRQAGTGIKTILTSARIKKDHP